MTAQNEFPLVFEKLKSMLKPYAKKLIVKIDTADAFSPDGASAKKGERNFSSARRRKKNYVSFYLMPVYVYPDLLKNISAELMKHMQGSRVSILRKSKHPCLMS